MSKPLKTLLKLVVSAGAIAFVLHRVGLAELGVLLRQLHFGWLLPAVLAFAASKAVAAARLNLHFAVRNLPLSPALNFRLYLVGMFYNLFLPGGIGGDGYKVYWLNQRYATGLRALIGAILWDRLNGITVLVFISILFSWPLSAPIPWLQLCLSAALLLIFPAFYALQWLLVRDLNRIFFRGMAISLVSQTLILVCVWMLMLSLGIAPARQPAYLVLFLAAAIIANVPVSLGGLGPRELVSLFGANELGLSSDTAVAISLLFFFVTLLVSLAGLYFVVYPDALAGGEQKNP
jgi:glycosyltransferase 2 family protein